MQKVDAIAFMQAMAIYFERQSLKTMEDSVYWSMLKNSENCKRIAEAIREGFDAE